MSIAPRDANGTATRSFCGGHPRWFGQRQYAALRPAPARCRTTWHLVGKRHGFEPFGRFDRTGPTHLGDHVAGPAHDDRVALADVLALRPRPRCAASPVPIVTPPTNTGSMMANGVTMPGPPRVHRDLPQQRRALLGRELVRDRPPRRVRRGAQLLLLGDRVDLDDHAVDLVVDRVPVALPSLAERRTPRRATRRPRWPGSPGARPRGGRSAPRSARRTGAPSAYSTPWHHRRSGRDRPTRRGPSAAATRPRRCAGWRTPARRGRAARRSAARTPLTGKYTSPRTSSTGGRPVPAELDRHLTGSCGCSRVTSSPVSPSPRVAPRTNAPSSYDTHDREAVDLQLAHEPRPRRRCRARRASPRPPARPRRTRCPATASGRGACTGREQVGRGAADALGRTVGRDQLGELGLERLELLDHLVVVEVGDLGVVQHVVAVRVVVDLLVQLLDPLPRVGQPPLLRPAPLLRLVRASLVSAGSCLGSNAHDRPPMPPARGCRPGRRGRRGPPSRRGPLRGAGGT